MKYSIEGSLEEFDYLDFEESTLFFHCPKNLPSQLDFQAWGLVIHTSVKAGWPDSLKRPTVDFDTQTNAIYVAGYSHISITEVMGGELSVTVYDPSNAPGEGFVRTEKGDNLYLKREWQTHSLQEGIHKYEIYCVIDWPPGYCYLSLLASGTVSVEFNLDDCIPMKQFIENPRFYGSPR